MVKGRKNMTIHVPEKVPQPPSTQPANFSITARNLPKSELGGVIFGCKHETKDECLRKQLFGLPSFHYSYVKNVRPGLPLFLFNYSGRKLHGIYEAAGPGQLNIDSSAWTEKGSGQTKFPAQVRINVKIQCLPLDEKQYWEILKDNYYTEQLFWFELDHVQTEALIALFKPLRVSNLSIRKELVPASHSNKSKALANDEWIAVGAGKRKPKSKLDDVQTEASIASFKPFPAPNPSTRKDPFPPSYTNQLKAPANDEWITVGAGKRKHKSKPSLGLGNVNKFVSVTWDGVCSSNNDPEEGAIRNHDSDWESDWESDLEGENLLEVHLNVSCHPEGANETSHRWSEASIDAPEDKTHTGEVSDWESACPWQNMQHNTSACPHVNGESQDFVGTDAIDVREFQDTASGLLADWSCNERELNETVSGLEADWSKENMMDSPLGVCSHLNEESQLYLEQSSAENFERVLRNLQELKRDSSLPRAFSDGCVIPHVQEEIRLPEEPCILDEEKREAAPTRHVHEESRLHHEYSNITELEQNTVMLDLYNENAEWGQIIKVLKKATETLEKKQVESDLELQQLRNVVTESERTIEELKAHVKELESKLSTVGRTSSIMFAKQSFGSEKVMYLIGGFDGFTCLSSLDSFSPSMDIVKPLKSMSFGRACASATALNGNLYVFGGRDDNSSFDTVLCYSTKKDEWTLSPNLICPKLGLAGATLNGKLFAIGGCYGSTYFSDVEMFDPALGKWINIQPMLQKRFALAAAELHGSLYAVGGFDGRCYLQSVERYDPRVGYWMGLPDMKTSRGWHSLAAFNDKLYAIGGHNGQMMLSSVEAFDPRVGAWMVCEPLSFARGYSAAAVIDDSILVVGGKQDDDHDLDVVERYEEGMGWTVTDFKSIGRRSYHSVVVL